MKYLIVFIFLSTPILAQASFDEDYQELYCETDNGLNIWAEITKNEPDTLKIYPRGKYKPPAPYEGAVEEKGKMEGLDTISKRHFINFTDRIAIQIRKEKVIRPANIGGDLIEGHGVLQGYDFVEIEVVCYYHENFG